MDLKNRLKMSFLIIIILPICLAIMTGKLIIEYQLNSIQKTYDMEFNTMQVITNPIQILNRVTRDVFNRIKTKAMKTPWELEDLEYIKELNSELQEKYSFLVVRKDEEIIFVGNAAKYSSVKNNLPSYNNHSTEVDGGIYLGGKNPILLKQQDFLYQDGSKGTIFVLTDVDNVVPQLKASAVQAVISFVLIIIITAFILIVWLYRGIIKPLNVLKRATKEMKEGNLNYSISVNSNDEIGQLCEDFEEMRIHLKELIEVKMQYEENSRELLSNISHDLKTPLTAIKGYAEGIIDGVADNPQKLDRYVKTIYTKANDMSSLVDELSLYARIDNNTVPYNFSIIGVDDYFCDCVDELSFELEIKNIKLEYENLVATDCKVIIDTEQLKRVIHNIVGNAVKYMGKPEGTVKVKLTDSGDMVEVEIEDSGCGIAEKDLPNIFERFYRADASRNSKQGGSGLGLAIAKKVIEEHGGNIWAKSEVGVGTSIIFTIMKWTDKEHIEKKFSKIKKGLELQVKD
ncbi:HAMP domain-containing sensor histidine kinase [Lachnoclostridium phytofermentans]|uniref:HAMP domain-containing sensor histidine kinase n=1 Tax=Lachnoclostridium phytofermentans TaxID=66219 RepID=UPI00055963DB|nr:HAMP domain-containing sensor histidine kinase [Lachnoclostridium phytofermentans]